MKKEIIPPDGGWKQNTWYVGKCSMRYGNPLFKVLIFSGFLDKKGNPSSYSGVFATNACPRDAEDSWAINKPLYLLVLKELDLSAEDKT